MHKCALEVPGQPTSYDGGYMDAHGRTAIIQVKRFARRQIRQVWDVYSEVPIILPRTVHQAMARRRGSQKRGYRNVLARVNRDNHLARGFSLADMRAIG
ncbi:hypothetical protein PG994_006977 [Apiospora phragmitis]|uniref:Uncharacterized protein n=1 Tax=Apiospora phragmitis TaxID=2905665 RepID=A0ABR1V2P0_9PEZI